MTTTACTRIAAVIAAAWLFQPLVAPAAPGPAPKAAGKPATVSSARPMLLSMKQVTVTIDPAGDAKANADKVAAFQSATLGIFSCADVDGVAQGVGATVTDAKAVPLAALPPTLRETVRTMKVGTATQMFGDRSEGVVRVLVLCARR